MPVPWYLLYSFTLTCVLRSYVYYPTFLKATSSYGPTNTEKGTRSRSNHVLPDWPILYHAINIKFPKHVAEKWSAFRFSNKRRKAFSFVHSPAPVMSLNTTVAAPFYQTVYADIDFSSLSWLEQRWVAWYVWIGNPIIATGLMAFLMHEVCILFNNWSILLIFFPLRCRLCTSVAAYHGLS
jgi:hypothetical protein